ncbi:hypothetical protein RCH10_001358 [Variovorax sp. GrIS 2.14]|jgi:hypothetical protein|uniref:hypothetical protein n=1 Tax=Variovorax sp. GrIS 2.14 TaxID=3071709 RepID=UPI0038F69D64
MKRCKNSPNAHILIALCAVLAPAAALFTVDARAQAVPVPQTQFEAEAGGRNFPIGTLRGKFMVLNPPEIKLDGDLERMSPGARVRSAQNMLVMPGAIVGQNLLVNYTRDASNLVSQVWILTPDEARADRESAEKPFLNFWPFVANSGPRDDGKTPFDQLPKYGE